MAVIFLDSNSGNDGDDGSTWALAKLTLQAALTAAGAGGTVFAQDDASGGFTETTAASTTYTSPGTKDNPTTLVACASGTTNEPPVTADLVLSRDDADLASAEVTGAGNDLTLAGFADVWGFKITTAASGDDIFPGGLWTFHHGIIHPGDAVTLASTRTLTLVDESELILDSGSEFRGTGMLQQFGGELTGGTAVLTAAANALQVLFSGVDLSSLSATAGFNIAGSNNDYRLENCKIPVSYVVSEGTWTAASTRVTMIGCDSSADHTNTIRQYRSETGQGFVVDDTPFISGGAQDRDSGDGYSFSMNLNDNTVLERFSPLYTEWYEVWIPLGTTSFTIEVMRKDTGAPADLFNDMFWVELMSANEGVGSATAQFAFQTSRTADPVATAAALTSSSVTWSSLGGDTAKKQKIVFTIAPEYEGMARYRGAYAERGTGILPAYFEPLPALA